MGVFGMPLTLTHACRSCLLIGYCLQVSRKHVIGTPVQFLKTWRRIEAKRRAKKNLWEKQHRIDTEQDHLIICMFV